MEYVETFELNSGHTYLVTFKTTEWIPAEPDVNIHAHWRWEIVSVCMCNEDMTNDLVDVKNSLSDKADSQIDHFIEEFLEKR
jgi:hypothetical protein